MSSDNHVKKAIRRVVFKIVQWTDRYCCTTFGHVSELSKGPCQRCVGMAVQGAVEDEQEDQP